MRWQYRDTVLVICTLALFVTVYGRLALSPVVPDVATEFDVSNAMIGAALSGMWLTYALTQFPSGLLAERYGERLVILASIAGTVLATFVIVAAPGFVVFSAGVLVLGALAGLHYSVATTLLTRVYDDIGTAIGVHNSGAPLAGLAAPVIVSWVAVRYGWRPAVALTVAVGVPVFVLAAWRIRPTEPRQPTQPLRDLFDLGAMRGLLSRPAVIFTGVIAIIVEFTWQAVASFLPAFFAQYHGYSTTVAGIFFGVYFLIQGTLQVGVGAIADRFGRDVAIGLCMAAGIAGLALLVTGGDLVTLTAGTLLLGIGMGWGAAVFPRFMDRLSADEQSFGFGLFRTVYMTVAASGSVVVGLLADLFGWAVSFGFLTALLGLVCALLLVNALFDLGY
ncbi:MFS transporter [Natronolimnohabitans innermongolicus]|uniref:Major facilitator superfamily protein n=1 Tax=Natronolimnohabitans innermongolicus JCM 12255 TaxID=1227499 RepID=L9XC90_9EURY|nr:MFS transporter [Natronolimnohabitans innermongolicus]ELY59026.1 major facilitator superfamily protein [Natronolimnohabitans innermongolicus JCM 12255]